MAKKLKKKSAKIKTARTKTTPKSAVRARAKITKAKTAPKKSVTKKKTPKKITTTTKNKPVKKSLKPLSVKAKKKTSAATSKKKPLKTAKPLAKKIVPQKSKKRPSLAKPQPVKPALPQKLSVKKKTTAASKKSNPKSENTTFAAIPTHTILPAGLALSSEDTLNYQEKITPPILPIHPDDNQMTQQYMNDENKNHFRQILLNWKQQLLDEMKRTVTHMQDDAAIFPDPNDRATQEEEFSLELRTRDRETKLIKKIEETLQRIDNDDYGYCEACGVEIGLKRLEARPTATLCIDCKTVDEIREKTYS